MARRALLCPTCKAVVPTSDDLRPKQFPFCGERCKQVDLGRWFSEDYVAPRPIDPDDHEAIEAVIAARTGEG